jgi:hypothetical protein
MIWLVTKKGGPPEVVQATTKGNTEGDSIREMQMNRKATIEIALRDGTRVMEQIEVVQSEVRRTLDTFQPELKRRGLVLF